jgi:lipoprotein-anchoring transpeptidase ErfK/SrfK
MVGVSGHQGSVLTEWQRLFARRADFLNRTAGSHSFWRIAVLAAAGIVGTACYAEAATSILWPDSDPGVSGPPPVRPQRPHKVRRHRGVKNENVKESQRPQGPLIIAISIEKQSLRIYDANGFFAETPISTGMRGHPTPMGIFSIIQKHKFHRSNIYSDAPMPYMQRITWSGVAMHAGVLPGYPASHGCIRMPMNFAVKMWGWTKMGARVVVTPGEITPSSFSHPLLTAQGPTPVAAAEKTTPSGTKSDKATVADTTTTSATSEAAPVLKREQALTADARSAQSGTPTTMSDATPPANGPASIGGTNDTSITGAKPAATATAATETVKASDAKIEPAKSSDNKAEATKAEPTKTDATVADLKKDQTRPSDADKAAAAKPDSTLAPKRAGQISVFVSRKDSKVYVRQNFAPLFEAPVTIASGDRPLGTHVFTAQADKDNPKLFHWSVVSLPATRHAELRDDDERVSRRRKTVGAVEMKRAPLPDSPAEALDRIAIPADVMAKITDALSTGGSIIVSDQGITAGETGEGTDFIVSLR